MRLRVLAVLAVAAFGLAAPAATAETVCVDDGVVAADSVCAEALVSVEWEPVCTDTGCTALKKPKVKIVLRGWCNGQIRPLPCDIIRT